MFISFKRVLKAGWLNFSRNSGLSFATVFILVLAILVITFLFVFKEGTNFLISAIRERVDISVYFKEESPEEEILKIKEKIAEIPEVKEVEYISKEKAFQNFVERHKENPILMESLEEIGENPFLASLNIKAFEASQYGKVSQFLEASPFKDLISKVDYHQKKPIIERLFSLTASINRIGIFFSLGLALIAILVAFNTIRLAIFNSKNEIQVMRLVGASNWFVRGPFLAQGALSGVLAALISLLLIAVSFYFLGPKTEILFPGLNVFKYFVANFSLIFALQFGSGLGLGVISSWIATRKYLQV